MKLPALSLSITFLSLLPNLLAFQSPHLPSQPPNSSANSNANSNSLKTTHSTSSATTKTTTNNPLIVFPDFEFTPQGICTSPQQFVDAQSRQWFTLRNVPGEGDCMFLAVAVAASLPPPFTSSRNSTVSNAQQNDNSITPENRLAQEQNTILHHFPTKPMDVSASASGAAALLVEGESSSSSYWHGLAENTREAVAQVLESSRDPLYIGKNRPWVKPHDLLRSATKQEGLLSTQDYLQQLRTLGRQGGLYGGGPELTVLSNLLQRPIAIYEIATDRISNNVGQVIRNNGICPIVCRGIFGDGLFDHPPTRTSPHENNHHADTNDDGWDDWKLHVLVVDASPLEKHACVLLPMPKEKRKLP